MKIYEFKSDIDFHNCKYFISQKLEIDFPKFETGTHGYDFEVKALTTA